MTQHDETRFLSAALRYTQQGAHTLLTHPIRPEDLALQSHLFCHAPRPLSHLRRRQHVWRLVAKITREVRSLGQDALRARPRPAMPVHARAQ